MKTGAANAIKLFQWAAKSIPAYKKFLKDNGVSPSGIKTYEDFLTVPIMEKGNYLRKYRYEELFQGRVIPAMISSSSGSSGEPFYWPRGKEQEIRGGQIHEVIFKEIFGIKNERTLIVVCFSMGTWIAGSFTVASCRYVSDAHNNFSITTPGMEKTDVLDILHKLAPRYKKVILIGYPPFLMDIVVEARKFNINLQKLNLKFLFAGENFSERWRETILELAECKSELFDSISIYGTADAEAIGHETPLSIFIRKKALSNKKFAKEIFGDLPYFPTLVQYNPDDVFFENIKGEIILTTKSGIPLVRYNIHDQGVPIPFESIFKLIKEFGYEAQVNRLGLAVWDSPFVLLSGRKDVSVTLYALNIYPENIKAGLEDAHVSVNLTGKFKAEVKLQDRQKSQKLHITVELARGVRPSKTINDIVRFCVFENLVRSNSEYRKLYAVYGQKVMPKINLARFGDPAFIVKKTKLKWTS